MIECYKNIIGITPLDNKCPVSEQPTDYKVSTSGLFLDELTGVSNLLGLDGCDSDLWSILDRSISSATTQFIADSNALLVRENRLKRGVTQNQIIGQKKAKNVLITTDKYAVVVLSCAPIKGGHVTIKKIGGLFTDDNKPVKVKIFNNVDNEFKEVEFTTLSNRYTYADIAIKLPLYSNEVDVLEYYLVYELDANNMPRDTDVDCGCRGGAKYFNRSNPQYNRVSGRTSWASFVMVGSYTTNTENNFDTSINTLDSKTLGLSLELDFSCDIGGLICDKSLNFEDDPLAYSVALAIRYYAGMLVANSILQSNLINRDNLINTNNWELNATEWHEKYKEHIDYIVSVVNLSKNDCFVCKSNPYGLTRKGLIA